MAARLIAAVSIGRRQRPPLGVQLALWALLPCTQCFAPAHAGADRARSFTISRGLTPPTQTLGSEQLGSEQLGSEQLAGGFSERLARTYPVPVRQAYPYSTNPGPQSLSLPGPRSLPLTMDPLAVCPSAMQTFLNNSTTRAVPFSVVSRSCDCYAQERAEGSSQDQSSRRCFP